MSQLNPGDLEKCTEEQIKERYPEEARKHKQDPYHHRYPRAEVSSSRSDIEGIKLTENFSSRIMTLQFD